MDEIPNVLSAIAILVSVGVAVSVVKWNRLQQRREWRFSVFRRLSGYRYRLSENLKSVSFEDGEPFVALNEARIVFGDCKGVQNALDNMDYNLATKQGELASDLTKVIREIGEAIDKRVVKDLTEKHISRVLVPPHSRVRKSEGGE